MKRVVKLFMTAVLFAGVVTACDSNNPGPGPDPDHVLVLTADKDEFIANGVDEVKFTVTLDGVDVTAGYQVCMVGDNGLCLTGPFATTSPGEYTFHAYNASLPEEEKVYSNEVTVTATVDPTFYADRAIQKNVAFFTYTATWCYPGCYYFKTYMKNIVASYGDKVVILNLHTDGSDDIGSNISVRNTMSQLAEEGRWRINAWPTQIVELRETVENADPRYIPTEADIRNAYNKYAGNSPKTGIMVDSKIDGNKVNATVTIGAKEAGDYSIGIFMTEDHVMAKQTGHTGQYDHTNVVREIGASSIFGDSMGAMTAGQTIENEFSLNINSKYNPENLNLVVYTLYEEDGHMVVDNSVKVTANGVTGYQYAGQ
jgi:hypothetical protein